MERPLLSNTFVDGRGYHSDACREIDDDKVLAIGVVELEMYVLPIGDR